jgi:hypothetical protein
MREPRVTLREGAGGGAMRALVEGVLVKSFANGGHAPGSTARRSASATAGS